jgi:hypothetical protein
METKTFVGHRVKDNNGRGYVHTNGSSVWLSYEKPKPISLAEAHRIVSKVLTDHPGYYVPIITKVFKTRTLTPLEATSRDLGNMLTSLLGARGVKLGLTQDQIEKQIAKELTMLGGVSVANLFR